MLKDRIKELVESDQYISGIHNYCDRWCERCPFTSRCMNFAIGEEQTDDPEARDINSEAFWEQLGETLEATMEMLQEAVAREDVDWEDIALDASPEEAERKDEIAKDRPCARAAKKYSEMVESLFEKIPGSLKAKSKELLQSVEMDLPGATPEDDSEDIKDAMEVVSWYTHFIWVKLMRGIRGEMDDRPAILDDFPKDSDGSVKVALIAVDRSLAAWGRLYNHFPELEDLILDALLHLDRLRKNAERDFPEARAFVRPGFDD